MRVRRDLADAGVWGLVDRALVQLGPPAHAITPATATATAATAADPTVRDGDGGVPEPFLGAWKTSMLLNALTKLRPGPGLASPAAQVRPDLAPT